MSRRPIVLSPDLLRLQNEGYDIHVRSGILLVENVPYVDADRQIQLGTLFFKLNLSGDITNKPDDHVAHWRGKHPCHANGSTITAIENSSGPQDFGGGLRSDFTFSAKADYRDYHHKVLTYVGCITGEAAAINSDVTARTYPPIPAGDDEAVFKYMDTASSRAGIGAINARLAGKRVGIAGLGGTGVYLLDFVVKTHVAQIHVADGDVFSQHNAFRAPGAPTLEQLQARPNKVPYFVALYSNMRNGIVPHDVFLDETNLHIFDGLDFVFVCLDRGPIKKALVARLIANGTSFIDVGMGIVRTEGNLLSGLVRVTTSTPETREEAAPHISYSDDDGEVNEYSTNIQIPELNAINAALAVVRFKKYFGLMEDARQEWYSGYSLRSGELVVEGKL